MVYDLEGKAHPDMYTANHKIASKFFGFVVDQEVSYLLGNGVAFNKDATKKALGATFDEDIMDAARHALIGGQSFVFWNLDHIQVFAPEQFVPLYDEEDGALKPESGSGRLTRTNRCGQRCTRWTVTLTTSSRVTVKCAV